MSDAASRRAVQKAGTRERIRATAQALFAQQGFEAVTVVQVAAGARVSVQTVFNHFSGKEELFFADRTPWVEGPADAVRARAAGERPKQALRHYLVTMVDRYARAAGAPQHRTLVGVLTGSPALLAYERSLHEEAVTRLGEALAEAWGCGDAPCRVHAEVTASIWLAAVRSVLLDLRTRPPADQEAVRGAVALVDRVLGDLDDGLSIARDGADAPCRAA